MPDTYRLQLTSARDQARQSIRSMIEDGLYRDGDRLEEVEISSRIGVSRTPVREALISLEGDGLVRSAPNKGFVVVTANEDLVREIYPILGALEGAALRLAAPMLDASAVSALSRINDRLARARVAKAQYDLDAAFHERIVRDCGNTRLLRLLDAHRTLARRIDGAHLRGTANRDGSVLEHAAIVARIENGDFGAAAELLIEHWRNGESVVANWLRNRE